MRWRPASSRSRCATISSTSCSNIICAEPQAELLAHHMLTLGRERNGARIVDAPQPAAAKSVRAERGADGAGDVRPPLAPVEAGPAQDAGRAAAAGTKRLDIDADATQELGTRLGNEPGIVGEFGIAACDQRIGKRNAEPSGKMIVAGAPSAQRGIARADRQR